MKRGKKYVEAAKNIDRAAFMNNRSGIDCAEKSTTKFDETIEAHIRSGLTASCSTTGSWRGYSSPRNR